MSGMCFLQVYGDVIAGELLEGRHLVEVSASKKAQFSLNICNSDVVSRSTECDTGMLIRQCFGYAGARACLNMGYARSLWCWNVN